MTHVSIMLVRGLVAAVERAGFERTQFISDAGLVGVQLDDVLARISLDNYERALRAAYATLDDPAFGLHLGERLSMGTFDVLGHLTEHSASLREAIELVLRYSSYISDGPRLMFEEQPETALLRFVLPENESLAALLASEFSTAAMLRLFRSFLGDNAVPIRAYFLHEEPAYRSEYERIFACELVFSQPFTGVEFDRAWLDHAPACRKTELQDYLLKRADLLLAKAERKLSMTERVRRWLDAQLDLSRPTLDQVSHELCVSTRSLRRHLQQEGAQFSLLVDESRARHAKRTLTDSEQSIEEAAYVLGFRTPSAFSRAFKRWTGMSPRVYRALR